MLIDTTLPERKEMLRESKVIAIVGLSPKTARPSNMVARYLLSVGYTIIPVNPGQSEILGQTCYASLADIPQNVDIVNIFRRSEDVPPIVDGAIVIGARGVWMQLGINDQEAADKAREAGLSVVMDRCIKIDHQDFV